MLELSKYRISFDSLSTRLKGFSPRSREGDKGKLWNFYTGKILKFLTKAKGWKGLREAKV